MQEYGEPIAFDGICAESGLDLSQVRGLFLRACDRLRQGLRVKSDPLRVEYDSVRAEGFAGLLRLSSSVELEVVPKFLDPSGTSWRGDFVYLAMMSRWGRILPADGLHVAMGDRTLLANLVAAAIVQLYWDSHRRPLRLYRATGVEEFAFDGEVDPEHVVMPPVDGYAQSVLRLSRRNDFNATIARAVTSLRGEVSDGALAAQLDRVVFALGKQERCAPSRMRRRRLPARHQRWQDLLLLAEQILAGLGLDYSDSAWLTGPGFVIRTADAWETLVFEALRLGSGASSVAKTTYLLGRHWRGRDAEVTPDVTLTPPGGEHLLLIDAKYKTASDKGARVASADLYEALAFMRASDTSTTLLVYPGTPRNSTGVPGAFSVFDRISVGQRNVYAATVEISGLSRRSGMRELSNGLATAASTFFEA